MDNLEKQVKIQGELVRDLKANAATPKSDLEAAIEQLKKLKLQLKESSDKAEADRKEKAAFRASIEDLLLRKFVFVPSFEIYGGVGGLYDYGPPGCAIMSNLQQFWRQHFVLTESMLEVACSSMTPEAVLKASGHVERFTDYMVQDVVTKDFYRADKLLEEHLEPLIEADPKTDAAYTQQINADFVKAGSMTRDELSVALKKYGIKSGDNEITDVSVFNLMFKTSIGPTGKFVGYLRPETAQGIFVNFRRLYEYNNRRLPFGAAQIGLAYRNEIAPRAGLLRVREFPLAEIEHFVHPEVKDHARFADVKNYELDLLPADRQDGIQGTVRMTAGDAVAQGVIDNQTLAYFMSRTHMFLTAAGVDAQRLRFRQHLSTEMAHYAKDCWDAEIHTSYGWIEVRTRSPCMLTTYLGYLSFSHCFMFML
jgi:glycyl-tRNA synthetase